MKHGILEKIMGNLERLAGGPYLSDEETEDFFAFKCNDGENEGPYGRYWNDLRKLPQEDWTLLNNREVPREVVDELKPIYESLITIAKKRIRRYGSPPPFEELDSM